MYFKFPCGNCGKSLKVSDEHVGRKARCPFCHTQQTVPPPPAPAADEPPSLDAYSDLEQEEIPVATKRAATPASSAAGLPGAPGAPAPAARAPSAAPPSEKEISAEAISGTDVSVMLSGLIGLAFTLVFYGIVWPIKLALNWHIAQIFTDRGWIQYASVFFFGWSAAILFLKSRKLAKQKESMLFDLLPTDISDEITPHNVQKFTGNIRGLPADPRESFLINRVLRGLEHYGVRQNTSEVASMLTSQSDIDANSVGSSYTILNTFLWAIPILGFIGTVIGIGSAVGGFSATMEAAQDLGKLKTALGGVTSGLATAFDTTLLALVMSVFIIFPTKGMQKAEEDLLNWVDEYCNENLLKRLKGEDAGGGGPSTGDFRKDMQKTINAAMADHHAELESWTERLEKIGATLTEKATRGWGEIHKRLQDEHIEHQKGLNDMLIGIGERQAEYVRKIEQVNAQLGDLQHHEVPQQTIETMRDAAESLQQYVVGMQQGLSALNDVLSNLGEQRVVIETRRRGWFWRK